MEEYPEQYQYELEQQQQVNAEEEIARAQSEISSKGKTQVSDSYAKWVQEAEDKLTKIRHALLGEYLDSEGNWVLHLVEKVNEKGEKIQYADWRIMNERGANFYIDFVTSWYMDKNTYMSKLRSERVNEKMRFIARRLAKLLWKNKVDWVIDFRDIEMLVFLGADIIEFALRRAEGGNEKNFLGMSGGAFTFGQRDSRFANISRILRGG